MSVKMQGIPSGLGDRLGNYLMYATIGEIRNVDVYTTWIYDEKSYGQRGTQYPDNIHEYISFPKRLKFVSSEELDKINLPSLGYRWIYHGFDYIPETLYKSMLDDNHIKCTYDEFINIYRNTCKELFYKKTIPINIKNNTGIIHIRRGDKGNKTSHTDRIFNLINKYDNTICEWIITSDEKIPEKIDKNISNLVSVNWSTDEKIKVLEQFFTYSKCSVIIQSVNLQTCHPSTWSGWAGFSYVAFQIGLANCSENIPILISCNTDDENTRLTHARKFAQRDLFNIYMYDNIIQ